MKEIAARQPNWKYVRAKVAFFHDIYSENYAKLLMKSVRRKVRRALAFRIKS